MAYKMKLAMKSMKIVLSIALVVLTFYGCRDMIIKPTEINNNVADFELAWNRVNDYYPFLDFKNINWDSLYTVYRERSEEARGDEFYYVLSDLLAELKDGHVFYKTPGGSEVYPYYPIRHFKDRHAYNPFVVREYFDKELILSVSGSVEYQILPDNIGYIFLADFHEDYLVNEFPGIMAYLQNTKGLIIDIRQKRGGSPQNVEAVVSRFISNPLAWPDFYSLGEPLEMTPVQPQGSFTYSNPVIVLINGSTYSAGELTTELLKQIPGVTAVGDTTGGGSGLSANNSYETRGEFELPSGKMICIPTGYIERYDGLPWEWLGIAPDISVEQTAEDIKNGIDRQLEFAIDLLK